MTAMPQPSTRTRTSARAAAIQTHDLTKHYGSTDPILNGMSGGYTLAIVAVGLIVVVVGAPLLERRDIVP